MSNNVYIPGGYCLKARCIQNSEIAHTPPYIREIFDWLVKEVNHKDYKMTDKVIRRGQCVRDYNDIREGLSWFVGFRKEKYKKWQVAKAVKWLRDRDMIRTQKLTRKMLFTVVNYNYYQDFKNYDLRNENESNAESNYDSNTDSVAKSATKATMKAPREQRGASRINNTTKKNQKEKASNMTPFLDLSLKFHCKQKADDLSHQDFIGELTQQSKIIINGANELYALHKSGESFEDIKRVLDFILSNTGNNNGWAGWKKNVVSLRSLRNKSKNDEMKYFQIKNQIPAKKKKPVGYGLR